MIENIFETALLLMVTMFIVRMISEDDAPYWYIGIVVVTFAVSLAVAAISGLILIWS